MTGANIDRSQKLQKPIVTIEFTALDLCRVQNFIKIEAFAVLRPKLWPKRWQVPTLTGVNIDRRQKLQKTIATIEFTPLDYAEYEISSKLKHLPFFVQNYDLKDDRCQHWQVSRITENYCHQWIQHSPFPFLKRAVTDNLVSQPYLCVDLLTWEWVFYVNINSGGSRPPMLYKIGVLKNFPRFTEKHNCAGVYF